MMTYIPYILPFISLLGLLYIGLRYINLFLKNNKLEDEFSSIVNHTFRTPITRILWTSKELEKDLPRDEKLNYIKNIVNATNKILNVVDTIVGIKKIDNLSDYYFEATSLRELTEESMIKFSEKIKDKNLTFNIPTFTNIPLLTVDLKKISFVINTLIENAVFYTPQNGQITVNCISNKENLVFSVEDTGIGLGVVDKLRIFSRFYRNKKAISMNTDGMGLCLYLSRKIIKRHKGKIYAKSCGKNKGSTFILKLPFKR
jgi:two-component system sensor histidine kinase VicK